MVVSVKEMRTWDGNWTTLKSRKVLRRSSVFPLQPVGGGSLVPTQVLLQTDQDFVCWALGVAVSGGIQQQSEPYNLYFSVFHRVPRSAPPLTDFSLACHKLSTESRATACRPAAKGSGSGLYLRPGGKWYLITASPGEERGRSRQHGTATNSSAITAQIKQPLQGQSPPSERLGSQGKAWTFSQNRKSKTAALASLCFALIFIWSRLTLSWPQQT